jgi:hypothetical protein
MSAARIFYSDDDDEGGEESSMPPPRKPTEDRPLSIREKRNRDHETSTSRDSRDVRARKDLAGLDNTDVQRAPEDHVDETTSPHDTIDVKLEKRSRELKRDAKTIIGRMDDLSDELADSIKRDEDEHRRLRDTIKESDSQRERDVKVLREQITDVAKKQEYGNGRLDELLKRNEEDEELKREALKALITVGIKDREADRHSKTADRTAVRTRWNKIFIVIGGVLSAAGIAATALIKGCG